MLCIRVICHKQQRVLNMEGEGAQQAAQDTPRTEPGRKPLKIDLHTHILPKALPDLKEVGRRGAWRAPAQSISVCCCCCLVLSVCLSVCHTHTHTHSHTYTYSHSHSLCLSVSRSHTPRSHVLATHFLFWLPENSATGTGVSSTWNVRARYVVHACVCCGGGVCMCCAGKRVRACERARGIVCDPYATRATPTPPTRATHRPAGRRG
jgi:hypothetical protein